MFIILIWTLISALKACLIGVYWRKPGEPLVIMFFFSHSKLGIQISAPTTPWSRRRRAIRRAVLAGKWVKISTKTLWIQLPIQWSGSFTCRGYCRPGVTGSGPLASASFCSACTPQIWVWLRAMVWPCHCQTFYSWPMWEHGLTKLRDWLPPGMEIKSGMNDKKVSYL